MPDKYDGVDYRIDGQWQSRLEATALLREANFTPEEVVEYLRLLRYEHYKDHKIC